jgi:hypothetical protein
MAGCFHYFSPYTAHAYNDDAQFLCMRAHIQRNYACYSQRTCVLGTPDTPHGSAASHQTYLPTYAVFCIMAGIARPAVVPDTCDCDYAWARNVDMNAATCPSEASSEDVCTGVLPASAARGLDTDQDDWYEGDWYRVACSDLMSLADMWNPQAVNLSFEHGGWAAPPPATYSAEEHVLDVPVDSTPPCLHACRAGGEAASRLSQGSISMHSAHVMGDFATDVGVADVRPGRTITANRSGSTCRRGVRCTPSVRLPRTAVQANRSRTTKKKLKRLISNSTALRVLYITKDMHRALRLGSMYPKSPSGRRDSVCTIKITTTAGQGPFSVTMTTNKSNGTYHRRLSTGWRDFCSAVGAEVEDTIAFTRGYAAGHLTVTIEKSTRPKMNKC